MFWNSKRSPLEAEEEDWIVSCWEWLLLNLADRDTLRRFPLVLPTQEFFPPTKETGHARAEHIFRSVARLTGTADWPFKLVPQDEAINPVLGRFMIVRDAPSDPAGTFAVESQSALRITYSPELLSMPSNLIATFAHEIGHALIANAPSEPPGGEEFLEYATDLTAAFMGFGIFGANNAFEFAQFSDMSSGTQGWSYRRSGYLSETQWGFCLGLFLHLRDETPKTALQWLKPGPAATLKKTLKYLERRPERLAALRGAAP